MPLIVDHVEMIQIIVMEIVPGGLADVFREFHVVAIMPLIVDHVEMIHINAMEIVPGGLADVFR